MSQYSNTGQINVYILSIQLSSIMSINNCYTAKRCTRLRVETWRPEVFLLNDDSDVIQMKSEKM